MVLGFEYPFMHSHPQVGVLFGKLEKCFSNVLGRALRAKHTVSRFGFTSDSNFGKRSTSSRITRASIGSLYINRLDTGCLLLNETNTPLTPLSTRPRSYM